MWFVSLTMALYRHTPTYTTATIKLHLINPMGPFVYDHASKNVVTIELSVQNAQPAQHRKTPDSIDPHSLRSLGSPFRLRSFTVYSAALRSRLYFYLRSILFSVSTPASRREYHNLLS